MKLKEYVTRVISECIKLSPESITISFDIYILAQYNYENKEWEIHVVSEDVSSSNIKFEIKV